MEWGGGQSALILRTSCGAGCGGTCLMPGSLDPTCLVLLPGQGHTVCCLTVLPGCPLLDFSFL